MSLRSPHLLAPLGLAALVALGCGGPPKPPEVPSVVWPPPPEVPRYKLSQVLRGEDDYQAPPSWFRRVFLGAKKASEMLRLKEPFGIACHPKKRIVYVGDKKNRLVVAFDDEARTTRVYGEVVGAKLVQPLGIAVDEDGAVYVVDANPRRVYAYAADGALLRVYGQHNELEQPVGIAVDRSRGRLYVSDVRKHAIIVLDLKTTQVVATFGKRGRALGEYHYPGFLALDRAGNLVVADQMNFRFQIISPDGKPLAAVGEPGNRPGNFFRLKGVAVDSEDHVYAVDQSFSNVQIFQRDGQLLLFLGQNGRRPGEFSMPSGACLTADDTLWISDLLNARIQGLQYLRNAQIPSRPAASQPASQPGARVP